MGRFSATVYISIKKGNRHDNAFIANLKLSGESITVAVSVCNFFKYNKKTENRTVPCLQTVIHSISS